MAANSFKPGPNNQSFTLIPSVTSAGGGIPVQITSLDLTDTIPGYPTPEYDPVIVATVKELTASGVLATQTYSNVHIMPDPTFAEVGDKGVMVTYTPTNGILTNVRYIQLNKGKFIKYTGGG